MGVMTLIAAVLLLAAPPTKARFADVERAYDNYRFDDAIVKGRSLLDDPHFTDGPSRQKLRALIAFSYYITQREAEASKELERLFRENVDYAIDRKRTHPDMLRFFDSEHARYLASLQAKPAPPASTPSANAAPADAAPAEPPRALAPEPQPGPERAIVAAPQTIGDRHKWLRIFPGGIGHFVNHDFGAGAAFLSLEAALVGANITCALLREQLRASNGKFRPGTNPLAYSIAMNVTALAAITLAVIEIVDAFVWSPARGRATLQEKLATDLGPLGTYRWVFGP